MSALSQAYRVIPATAIVVIGSHGMSLMGRAWLSMLVSNSNINDNDISNSFEPHMIFVTCAGSCVNCQRSWS